MIALEGARDFFTGDTIELGELDDHHIFPQDFLKKQKVDQDTRNTILNRTLINRDSNQRIIRAKRPSVYLAEMEELHGEKGVRQILASHFINTSAINAMRADDYEAFLRAREAELGQELHRRCVFSTIGLASNQPSPEAVEPGEEASRIDRVEAALRDVIDERLSDAFGPDYWKQIVPPDIRSSVAGRLEQRAKAHPKANRRRPTTRERLDFCDFSDYERLIFQKNVWPELEGLFSPRGDAERHLVAARHYRNTIKHGREADTVKRLAGEAAVLWLERVLEIKDFEDSIQSSKEPTVEDCLRVLVRRPIPRGQRELYKALIKAGKTGLSSDDLIEAMGRRDGADLAGVLGALGRRINNTPGFGEAKRPGIEMILKVTEQSDGGYHYALRPIMVEALHAHDAEWLTNS